MITKNKKNLITNGPEIRGAYNFYKFENKNPTEFISIESYQPLDIYMEDQWNLTLKTIYKHFSTFSLFDPQYAEEQIGKIQIDGRIHTDIDLWQAIFTTNIGIIM